MSEKFASALDFAGAFGAGQAAIDGFMKNVETLVAQSSGFATRSLGDTVSVLERAASAGSAEEIAAIQNDFLRSVWKNSVEGATALSGLAADMTRDVVGPIERAMRPKT
ncbi:MAG: phasin family protein [Mesorhizobium sp.]